MEVNTVAFLSVGTDKNLKDCGQENVGAVPLKLFACILM
jgi:hypothetical protein